jgi:hypothetical protein
MQRAQGNAESCPDRAQGKIIDGKIMGNSTFDDWMAKLTVAPTIAPAMECVFPFGIDFLILLLA